MSDIYSRAKQLKEDENFTFDLFNDRLVFVTISKTYRDGYECTIRLHDETVVTSQICSFLGQNREYIFWIGIGQVLEKAHNKRLNI